LEIAVRPLQEADLAIADHVFRMAFGTFLGIPDPASFMGDADLVRTRWRNDPTAAFGAYRNDELVGSNFATNWGSFGFFGPLTVRPDMWDQGIAQRLLQPVMELFARWGTRQVGLFTFPHSPKHIALYQKFGFWPQYLTMVMMKTIEPSEPNSEYSAYSAIPAQERGAILDDCRSLTNAIFPGLDVTREIESVAKQRLGDTVLIRQAAQVIAFAVCHIGGGSEAGSGSTYVKFGAVRPEARTSETFNTLLTACENIAVSRGAQQLVAGINLARHEAYRAMLDRGFRIFLPGIAMLRPNEPGYNRADCFVIDDWR
jgi:GNAT superfamily N-acetyltransferase